MGRGQADEALAALGQIRAQNEVLLAACAGDLLDARRLTVHLAIQVHIHGVINGNEIIQCRHGAHIVGIADGRSHAGRVIVQIVVELLGSGGEGVHLAAPVQILTHTRHLARQGQVHIGVHIHLRMYAQILQVRLAQHSAHGVGHAADAQLQAGAVGDLLHDELGHGLIHLGGGVGGLDAHGVVAPLHDHVHLGNMDAVVKAAQTPGHILVDLHDDHLGLFNNSPQMGGREAEVEVAVLIHGRHLEHGHIRGGNVVGIVPGQLGITHGLVEARAAGNVVTLHRTHVVGIENNVVNRVRNVKNGRFPQADAASDLHILQLRGPPGQGLVQHPGMDGAEAVVHPVAGLDDLHRLVRRSQFLPVYLFVIHIFSPPSLLCFAKSTFSHYSTGNQQKTAPL